MTKLAPEWVRTSDPVIRSPARYRWTTAPAMFSEGINKTLYSEQMVGMECASARGTSSTGISLI